MQAAGKIVPVVLAGGTGTRLWPLSRNSLPKQFLTLASDKTLYQETLLRVPPGADFHPPVIITNEDFRFFARRQASEIGIEATVILEPARRDSAPALLAATALVQKLYGVDSLILALAADHVVLDPEAFRAAVKVAAEVAAAGRIVTFGITPNAPRTSYGYIRRGAALPEGGNVVDAFVEKPDHATAAQYVADGYLWNSGNFLFPAALMIAEAEHFEPDLARAALHAAAGASDDLGFLRLEPEAFNAAPAKSIDFAVLERTSAAAVVAGDFGWSDIGSWDAMREIKQADADGNVIQGSVALLDSRDSYVRSEGPLVTGIGLDGISVVATEDAVLVMPSDRSQDVKLLVASLKAAKHNAADEHMKMHRPWGTYQTICRGDRFHVKKIVVEPGAKLSLQKHHHRSEHWVVVRGTAEVTVDGKVFAVHENESTYIPLGGVHRLANPGRIPLELIEVQTGSYLGEDDIVRLEDIYNRS
ncbi:mannose-1-phosphate guanylyltransferase/mannose-6-phosphate isomerase [Aquabacter sp. CN5-332]|uniref:mannose-1-phosphate guanylyltransferase/mannose-6-phosphate isomerase n=1 Tax=Aquabacter sp. CN5-332 TaxID=3156608 RepID=UPI0032B3E387